MLQISVEQKSALGRRMTVQVVGEKIDIAVSERLHNLSKKTRLAGFRIGKVPLKIIEQHHGKTIRSEVIHDLIQSSFHEAITKEKLNPAGIPRIEHDHARHPKKGEPLIFIAEFDVFPEIKINDFNAIQVKKYTATVTPEKLDNTLDTIRKQHGQWEASTTAAQLGDQVVIDFEGSLDGKPLPNANASNLTVEIGSQHLLPDLEHALIGAVAGQQLTVESILPAAYRDREAAGKNVQFSFHVHTVKKLKLPVLDDTFATLLGIKDGGVASLRTEVQKTLERELLQILKNKLKQDVIEALYQANPVELPNALVTAEIQRLQTEMQARTDKKIDFQAANIDINCEIEVQARRRVNISLVLSEIIKNYEIKLDKAKLNQLILYLSASYEQPGEAVKWFYADKKRLHEIETLVLEDQIVEKVITAAQLIETSIDFDEALKLR